MRAYHRHPAVPAVPIPRLPRLPRLPRIVPVLLLPVLLALAGCAVPAQPNLERDQVPGPPAPWAWAMPGCVAFQPDDYRAARHRVSSSVPDRPGAGAGIEVYEPGWGERAVAEIRRVVRTCGSFEDGDVREQHTVVESGFAADESLLVETVRLAPPDPPRTWYATVARHGDVVVTVRVEDVDRQEAICLIGADRATCADGQA